MYYIDIVCLSVCLCLFIYLLKEAMHATWAVNPPHKNHRLTEIPGPGMRNLPHMVTVSQRALQAVQTMAAALRCLSEVGGERLLLKTPHT